MVALLVAAVPGVAAAEDPAVPPTPSVTAAPSVRAVPSVGATAPVRVAYDVRRARYAGPPVSLPVRPGRSEFRGEVTWPVDAAGRVPRAPVVTILHGRHQTCWRRDRAQIEWPCPRGWRPIDSYLGYRYAADRLARAGAIVVSVSLRSVDATVVDLVDGGAVARAAVADLHLRRLAAARGGRSPWFPAAVAAAADLDRVMLVGHSRGGEAVVAQALQTQYARRAPYRVRGVVGLAPTNDDQRVLPSVPMAVVLPTCDGDVFELTGQRYLDLARTTLPGDPALRTAFVLVAGNHNFMNTQWTPRLGPPGASNDADQTCLGRRWLPARVERAAAARLLTTAARAYLMGDPRAIAVMAGERRLTRRDAGGALVHTVPVPGPGSSVLARPGRDRVTAAGLSVRTCPARDSVRRGCAVRDQPNAYPHWVAPSDTMVDHPVARALDVRTRRPGTGRLWLTLPRPADLRAAQRLGARVVVDPGSRGLRLALAVRDTSGRVAVAPVPGVRPRVGPRQDLPRLVARDAAVRVAGLTGVDLGRVAAVGVVVRAGSGRFWVLDIDARTTAGLGAGAPLPPLLSAPAGARIRVPSAGRTRVRLTATVTGPRPSPVRVFLGVARDDRGGTGPKARSQRTVTVPAGRAPAVIPIPVAVRPRANGRPTRLLVVARPLSGAVAVRVESWVRLVPR